MLLARTNSCSASVRGFSKCGTVLEIGNIGNIALVFITVKEVDVIVFHE
jgi:hypothetical protein